MVSEVSAIYFADAHSAEYHGDETHGRKPSLPMANEKWGNT